jgi:hypothetical protein
MGKIRRPTPTLRISQITTIKNLTAVNVLYQLIDVNENAAIGYYMQPLNDEKTTRCEVEAKRCQSSKEWTDLVTPYLHE